MIHVLQVIVVGCLFILRGWQGRFIIKEEGHTIIIGRVFVVNLGFDGLDSVSWMIDELSSRVLVKSFTILHLSLISRLSEILNFISI